jgi:DNA-binding beta-propeller fold protein YncE/mono/diheme cytochrome c family protein
MPRLPLGCAPLLTACLLGCGPQPTHEPHSAGTLALTRDDALLYAVDADNRIVARIDTASGAKLGEVPVGAMPEQIVLGPDDTAYVANRGDRTISVFRREAPFEVRTVPVGVEPVGIALSDNGARLYVVNAASLTDVEHGSLMAVDTSSLTVEWELLLPPEPRGIALLNDKRAVVSLYREGHLVEVDLATPNVARVGTGLKAAANKVDSSIPPGLVETFSPRGMNQLLVSPDRTQIYAAVTWASDRVLNAAETTTTHGSSTSTYGNSSDAQACTGGAVATSGIATFKASNLEAMVAPVNSCEQAAAPEHPPTRLVGRPGTPYQGPVAMVVDHGGTWVYVALRESDNVAIVPTASTGGTTVKQQVPLGIGAAPTGLALTSDGRTLYVHSSFQHEVRTLVSSGTGASARVIAQPGAITVANEVLPDKVIEGRRLFFSASDAHMNNPSTVGIACATCHLEGRDDGHVWNFVEGPRQTPSLAGRQISSTAPFHWGGEHTNFTAFLNQTINARMGGTGLEPGKQAALLAFIDSLPLPDNPSRLPTPTDAQVRGEHVFQKAGCDGCHTGASFTNNGFANVGTLVADGPVKDDVALLSNGLNTPSLLGVARTAPYLHDGSAHTLRARILRAKSLDLHGRTSSLTDAEVSDLVEYLHTL